MSKVINDAKLAIQRACPCCEQGVIFPSRWTLETIESCPHCALPLAKNDSGDGPAVFMIFILGALLMPMALVVEVWLRPHLWVHVVVWGIIGLAMCAYAMQPLKAYVMLLQYRHLPESWRKD